MTSRDGAPADRVPTEPILPREEHRADRQGWEPQIHWGAVLAGVLTALTAMFILASLGAAVGLGARPRAAVGISVAELWSIGSGLVAFFVGGWVAAAFARVRSPGTGVLHGALVFMAAVPLILWLISQGAGATWAGAMPGSWDVMATSSGVANADTATAAQAARVAAFGAFLGALLGLAASAVGGWISSRRSSRES